MRLCGRHSGYPPGFVLPPAPLPAGPGVFFTPLLYGRKYGGSTGFGLPFRNFVRTFQDMGERMGRPPKGGDKAMEGRLEIRIDPAEKAAYDQAAAAQGMDRSDWIRLTLNAAAKRTLRGKRRGL